MLTVSLVAVGPAKAEPSAGDVAQAFCAARVKDDEAATRALLTPSLLKEIAEAERRNDIIAKEAPDDKPPLGDGIPYEAFQDAVATCIPGAEDEMSGRRRIGLTYTYASAQEQWTDRLVLANEGERLLVDDIMFANVADGTEDLTLRQVLLSAFDQ